VNKLVRLIVLVSRENLEGKLDELNESGATPTLAAIDRNGVAFLASLHEVDGDITELVFIGVNEDGGPTALRRCDECAKEPWDWAPQYPVYVMEVDQ
jgi:hypothetical protein